MNDHLEKREKILSAHTFDILLLLVLLDSSLLLGCGSTAPCVLLLLLCSRRLFAEQSRHMYLFIKHGYSEVFLSIPPTLYLIAWGAPWAAPQQQ